VTTYVEFIPELVGKRQRYLPPGIDKRPETVVEALKAAKAATIQEGVWCKGEWFQNPHPEVDPQDAFCNNWQACAQGLIASVTIGSLYDNLGTDDEPHGVWRFVDYSLTTEEGTEAEQDSRLYQDTVAEVEKTLWERTKRNTGEHWARSIPSFNDDYGTKRDDVVELFQETIERLEASPFVAGSAGG
jgi:hypothetical protein